jgi:hypothetical protein
MQALAELEQTYKVPRPRAWRILQDLDDDPGVMSPGLYKRFVLMRWVDMSLDQIDRFLTRYGYEEAA